MKAGGSRSCRVRVWGIGFRVLGLGDTGMSFTDIGFSVYGFVIENATRQKEMEASILQLSPVAAATAPKMIIAATISSGHGNSTKNWQ